MNKGERIKQARELRKLTQAELGQRVGTENQSVIAHLESGRYEPSSDLLGAIALQTGFPLAFFTSGPTANFSQGSLAFRARSKLSARDKAQICRYAELAHEMWETLSQEVQQRPVKLPRIGEPPEHAARSMRAALGIPPDTPVKDLIHVLEQFGVRVLRIPLSLDACDAFSLWTGESSSFPVLAMLSGKPGDRQRFSVAHELRHLSYAPNGSIQDIERDADRFAAEFLLPEKAIRQELHPPLVLSTIAPLKPRWGCSMQMLIRRAWNLGIATERQYHHLMRQMTLKGWRKQEPPNLDVPAEKPRVFRKTAEEYYGVPLDYRRIARDVCKPLPLVRDLLTAHAGKPGKPEERGMNWQPKGKVLKFQQRDSRTGRLASKRLD